MGKAEKAVEDALVRGSAARRTLDELLMEGMKPEVMSGLKEEIVQRLVAARRDGHIRLADLRGILDKRLCEGAVTEVVSTSWNWVFTRAASGVSNASMARLQPLDVLRALWGEYTDFPAHPEVPPWFCAAARKLTEEPFRNEVTFPLLLPSGITLTALSYLFSDKEDVFHIEDDSSICTRVPPATATGPVQGGWSLMTTASKDGLWNQHLDSRPATLAETVLFLILRGRADRGIGIRLLVDVPGIRVAHSAHRSNRVLVEYESDKERVVLTDQTSTSSSADVHWATRLSVVTGLAP